MLKCKGKILALVQWKKCFQCFPVLNFGCSQEDGRWIGDYVQERQLEMLKSLLYSSTPRSTESLMAQWSVSERTIKYDLSQLRRALKEHGVKLLNKKGVGYYFSPADKPTLIDAYSFSELENTEEETRRDDCSFFFYK